MGCSRKPPRAATLVSAPLQFEIRVCTRLIKACKRVDVEKLFKGEEK